MKKFFTLLLIGMLSILGSTNAWGTYYLVGSLGSSNWDITKAEEMTNNQITCAVSKSNAYNFKVVTGKTGDDWASALGYKVFDQTNSDVSCYDDGGAIKFNATKSGNVVVAVTSEGKITVNYEQPATTYTYTFNMTGCGVGSIKVGDTDYKNGDILSTNDAITSATVNDVIGYTHGDAVINTDGQNSTVSATYAIDPQAILNGTTVMFYHGDTWGAGTKYVMTNGTTTQVASATSSSASVAFGSYNMYYTYSSVPANTKYGLSNNSTWVGVTMSDNVAAGNAYVLTNNGSNVINVVTSSMAAAFSNTSVSVYTGATSVNLGCTTSGSSPLTSATTLTTKYYYTTSEPSATSTWTEFDPSSISSFVAGTYYVKALVSDGNISIVSTNSCTMNIIDPVVVKFGYRFGNTGWTDESMTVVLNSDGTAVDHYTISKDFSANTIIESSIDYGFKIIIGDTYYGNNATMNYFDHSGWWFFDSNTEHYDQNCGIETGSAGTYVFNVYTSVQDHKDQPVVSVTYPDGAYTRNIAEGNYGTICLPYDATSEGVVLMRCAGRNSQGMVFNYVAADGETISETPVNNSTIKAGVPYLYRATADAQTFTATGTEWITAIEENGFYGVYKLTDISQTIDDSHNTTNLFLNTVERQDVAGNTVPANTFCPAGENVKMPGYRCYITSLPNIDNSLPVAGRIVFGIFGADPMQTGLNELNAANAQNGKYLVNGNIVLVKNGKLYNVAGMLMK